MSGPVGTSADRIGNSLVHPAKLHPAKPENTEKGFPQACGCRKWIILTLDFDAVLTVESVEPKSTRIASLSWTV
jgi:hypothetical protein